MDLATIRKLEALLTAGGTALENKMESPGSSDFEELREEDRLRQAYASFESNRLTVETLARLTFGLAMPDLALCGLSGAACLPAAATLAAVAPAFAAISLSHVAGMLNVQLQPNTLEELQVSPSVLTLRMGEESALKVQGRFVPVLEASPGVETAVEDSAAQLLSSLIGRSAVGLPAGNPSQMAVVETVAQYLAGLWTNYGLAELAMPAPSTARAVNLSSNTVSSTCFRGSSPSPGIPFLILALWEVRPLSGMSTPETCRFMPRESQVLVLPAAKAPVSTTIQVLEGPGVCRALGLSEPLFDNLYSITQPNQNGDSVALGDMRSRPGDWSELRSSPRPSFPNQTFCGRITLVPGCTAEVYVPTTEETIGYFPGFVLVDPLIGVPFPGGFIPASRLGPDLVPLRIRAPQGCS